jgi:tetratricopeptide (TPR) repeat protein
MARHLSGTSEPSMAVRRHSERTTLPLFHTVHNMAIVFDNQGEYGKALEWYQRALDGKEKTLGKDHPSTLQTVNNMALVFSNQGEYGKALEWYQRALDGTRRHSERTTLPLSTPSTTWA